MRISILKKEKDNAHVERKARETEEMRLTAFSEDFLNQKVSPDEIEMVRQLIANAVRDGQMEALFYSFPSDLCTDRGRAINNNEPHWPETLQGKAREFFDHYQEHGRSQGYKLKAMVISFPGGVPGDIGLFLSWAPPVK